MHSSAEVRLKVPETFAKVWPPPEDTRAAQVDIDVLIWTEPPAEGDLRSRRRRLPEMPGPELR